MHRIITLLFIGLFAFGGCKKDPITTPKEDFTLVFENEFNLLQGQFAAFLSDAEGTIKAFKWLDGVATSTLTVKNNGDEQLNCTIAKITILDTSAGPDTTLEITTYEKLVSGSTIHLRNLSYKKSIDYRVQFKNITSLDTIIVPDGVTFIKPQASNNFFGHYKIYQTGDFWLRFKINGDPHWRYMIYNNFEDTELTDQIDPNILPKMSDAPPVIGLPFYTNWDYSLEGVLDLQASRLIPIGDLDRAPGGAVPVLNQLTVYKPDNQVFSSYHVKVTGYNGSGGGYTYFYDRLFDQVPTTLPDVDFDVNPTTLNDGRLIAVNCSGDFDAVVITRKNNAKPSISWQYITGAAKNNGTVTVRLPDVPEELSNVFIPLKSYNFAQQTLVRAERYEFIDGIDAVYAKMLTNSDPFWQAKAQMMGIERQF